MGLQISLRNKLPHGHKGGGNIDPGDTTPDPFAFTDVNGAALSTLIESNAIVVAGIDGTASMSVSGGEYQKNGGAWASAPTTAALGDSIKVRGTSSPSNSTPVNVVLTIGGVSDTFTITTEAAAGEEDFLQLVDGASFLLLANGTDRLILAGPPF